MHRALRQALQGACRAVGVTVSRTGRIPDDIDPATAATIDFVRPFTMTSPERIDAVCQATRYVVDNEVPGAVVECGVWRGGSMMAVARTLLELGERGRDLHLFDTFDGMVRPGPLDRHRDGAPAADVYEREVARSAGGRWCGATQAEVRAALARTGYPAERVHLVAGRVEDTLPDRAPGAIALLRLDTDWYESTRHELDCLWPAMSPGGVVIVDDYGYWQGSRRAVDEHLAGLSPRPLLARVDDSARMAVVPGRPGPAGDRPAGGGAGRSRSSPRA